MPGVTVEESKKHEFDAQKLIKMIDALLVDVLRAAPEAYPAIFGQQNAIYRELHGLLSDSYHLGRKAGYARARDVLEKGG